MKNNLIKIIPFLKSENDIIAFMRASNLDYHICEVCLPLLKLEEKSEDQIMAIMERTGYDWYIYSVCISFLKSPAKIIATLEDCRYNNSVQEVGIPRLKLKEKSTNQLIAIMRKSGFNGYICEACLPFLKKKK